ncbi:hypothetical protein BDR22DRAFT_855636 [Usnea florida]
MRQPNGTPMFHILTSRLFFESPQGLRSCLVRYSNAPRIKLAAGWSALALECCRSKAHTLKTWGGANVLASVWNITILHCKKSRRCFCRRRTRIRVLRPLNNSFLLPLFLGTWERGMEVAWMVRVHWDDRVRRLGAEKIWSVIPKYPPLNTDLRFLLEDVAHHLSNAFDIVPTKTSYSDVSAFKCHLEKSHQILSLLSAHTPSSGAHVPRLPSSTLRQVRQSSNIGNLVRQILPSMLVCRSELIF